MLIELHGILREALPDVQECISCSMPTWRGKENILHFALSSKYINLHVGKGAMQEFADRLNGYAAQGGAIRLDPGQPLPKDLIIQIARWCAGQ